MTSCIFQTKFLSWDPSEETPLSSFCPEKMSSASIIVKWGKNYYLQGDFSELLDKELILWLSKKPQEIVWGRNWKTYVWRFLLYDGWCLTPLFSCWIIFFKIRCRFPTNCLHSSEDACLRPDLGFQADSGFTYAFH